MTTETLDRNARRWELLVPHSERLRRLARSRLGNAHDAEDCVQETLLRAANFDRLDERRIGAFLTTTALRLCIDYYRDSSRQQRLRLRNAVTERSVGPEEIVCEHDVGRWMMAQVRSLRGREREVMLARARGLSTAEAAGRLGISTKSAERAFTRGRARLRAIYERAMAA
jgi:RNA polymerase sigma factor (sigma-70 family)